MSWFNILSKRQYSSILGSAQGSADVI